MASAYDTPSPGAYSTLRKEQGVGAASTRAVALPQAMPGYEVQRSTLDGGIPGWDSRATAPEVHIVDPDGGSFRVDMTKTSAAAIGAAAQQAHSASVTSIDEFRQNAYDAYQQVVNTEEKVEIPGFDRPAPAQPDNYDIAPHVPAPVAAIQPQAPAPPAAQAPQQSLFQRVQSVPPAPSPAPAARPGSTNNAPTYKVSFEVDGAPMTMESWYHQVIRNEHVLVLCYNNDCIGYPRNRLQPTQSDIALHVEGSDSIYIVVDPSISFEHNGEELHVFLIKAEHPYERRGTAGV